MWFSMYSAVYVGKNLSDKFLIENGLKQKMLYYYCFSTLLLNMPLGLIRFSIPGRYCRKNGSIMVQYVSYS
jgi:hypothetical protein